MTFEADLTSSVRAITSTKWNSKSARVVPRTQDVALRDGAKELSDAVFLYSDMADSTGLVRIHADETVAKVIRAYLSSAVRILRRREGHIRSFDGDRVMAVFLGTDAASRAARCALEIKWAVDNIVQPEITSSFRSIRESGWTMKQGTGIDMGYALMVRAGIRDSSDLISVGDAANIAAKLSEFRDARTWVTEKVWDAMDYESCFSDGKAMWSEVTTKSAGPRTLRVRSSNWGWVIG